MATTKSTHAALKKGSTDAAPKQGETFGLLANGSCGPWEVAIDEYTGDAARWCAQLDGPSVSFYFEIPSLEIIRKMACFLHCSTRCSEQASSLRIGKSQKTPVTLIRDHEYGDRFILVVGRSTNPIVRFVIAGHDVANIAEALRQVNDDIDEG